MNVPLKIEDINVEESIANVRRLIKEEKSLSPALSIALELLLTLITLLLNRLGLNSQNSSTPPASDPNRKKKAKNGNGNKPGGQKGHVGKHLELDDDPDQIEEIKVDPKTLPADGKFQIVGYERRQVFDIDISRFVTEYRAEIMEDENGRLVVAPFPSQAKPSQAK